MQNSERPLRFKSYHFAIKIIQFSQGLVSKQKEFVLSRQILKSGTANCTKEVFENLLTACKELIALLISSLKTLKKN